MIVGLGTLASRATRASVEKCLREAGLGHRDALLTVRPISAPSQTDDQRLEHRAHRFKTMSASETTLKKSEERATPLNRTDPWL